MDQIKHILIAYDLYPFSMTKIKSIWKVATAYGNFALKHTLQTKDRLWFVLEQLRTLQGKGFTSVLPLFPSKYGEYFIPFQGGHVYVTPWKEGETGEQLLADRKWIPKLLEAVGRMHRESAREDLGNGETLAKQGDSLLEDWNRRLEDLYQFRQFVSERIYPSPVDFVFHQNYDRILRMAEEAVQRLKEWLEQERERESVRLAFCHGRIHPYHVIRGDQLYLLNFDRASLDLPVRDLSYFFRYMALQRVFKPEDLEEWLTIYHGINPLRKEEVDLLQITLSFPFEILRFLEDYYRGIGKGWTEMTLVRRFERLLAAQYALNLE